MKVLYTSILLLFLPVLLSAQYTINNEYSTMEIDGTSNVHDWTEVVETLNGKCDAIIEGQVLKSISKLTLKIPVKSIKSGKSTMDKNTYKAMNADKHPDIKFNLKSASIANDKVLCTGTLTIAGVAKQITVSCTYKMVPTKKQMILNGSYKMKMSSFGIEPPTAMMGAMRTGDDLTIKFSLVIN